MAKKKTAAAKKPAKKATTKAAKKTAAAAAATQPTAAETAPAPRPPCPEPEATHRKILQVCARQGIVISYQQLALLADAQIREVAEWARVVDESLDEHVPSLPQCLLDFQTRDVPRSSGLPARRSLNCEFGAVSVGDNTARIPVVIDGDSMDPNTAAGFFRGRRLSVILCRAPKTQSGQKTLPGIEESSADIRVNAVCDIKKFSVQPKHYGFSVTLPLGEIDEHNLMQLAMRSGSVELEVLGDAEDNGKPKAAAKGPHPDVVAGQDRPHGTPALEALAQARREMEDSDDDSDEYRDSELLPPESDQDDQDEEFGDGVGDDDDDEHPATLKLPTPAGEKLYLCQPQLAASLKLACVDTVPPEMYAHWTDEQRDELDVWARMVARHAGGDTTIPLPPVPVEIQGLLPTQQFQNPVGFARAHGTRSQLRWHCVMCGDEYWDVSRARRCPQCDAGADQPDQVILLGFYGDPNVDFEGDFAGSDVECYTVLPETPTLNCSIRVVQGADGRWRTGLQAELIPAEGEPVRINRFPSFRDSGRTSRNDAIAAEIGRLIDQWGALVCAEAEEVVPVLKEYLARIEGGADPLELEHALPEAAS